MGHGRRSCVRKGDIINIPTGIFRGFENVGVDYGMIMAVLGGDDAGGGVIWAPQVIEEAKEHGLILSNKGKLYDTKKVKISLVVQHLCQFLQRKRLKCSMNLKHQL